MMNSMTARWDDPIDPPISLLVSATLSITKGIVEVVCESNLFGNDNYDGHVNRRANDLARTVVNSYAFGRGMGLSVVLETVTKPDGITHDILEHRDDLVPLVTVLRSGADGGIDIQGILPIVLSDPTIFVALNDLIGCITYVQDAPIKCGRAIEAIRHSMAPAKGRKQGYLVMQKLLNIEQKYSEFISDQSKGPRHGDVKGTTFAETRETVWRSWNIMNRFLEFKKCGDQALSISEFPLLKN
jgi:hypothetical protein